MKSTGNAGLLGEVYLPDCLGYVLSLPIHCLSLGCTTVGQIEDDVRIAQQFRPMTEDQMARVRKRAARLAGPRLENWKRDTHPQASANRYWDGERV
jgi:hypothetical protein